MDIDDQALGRTTRSHKDANLNVALACCACNGPIHLVPNSSGLAALGDGHGIAAKHDRSARRSWKKLHLGAHAPADIDSVIAGAACGSRPIYRAVESKGADQVLSLQGNPRRGGTVAS